MAETFEQVDRVRAGFDDRRVAAVRDDQDRPDAPPESAPEWVRERIALMGSVARAAAWRPRRDALLERGEAFDVKAVGRELDDACSGRACCSSCSAWRARAAHLSACVAADGGRCVGRG